MSIFTDAWSGITFFLALSMSFLLCFFIFDRRKSSVIRKLLLCAWHFLFCLIYVYYIYQNGGDAIYYYEQSLDVTQRDFRLGTSLVIFITSFFSSVIGMSFLGVFTVFHIFGLIGLLAFDESLQSFAKDKSRVVKLISVCIVFLPSISFWSSAIGKDSIAFMSIGLALWASLDMRKRMLVMFISISLMLLVRPHIAAIFVIASACSFVFQKKINLKTKLFIGVVLWVGMAAIVPFALQYAGVSVGATPSDVMTYIDERQGYNTQGGGGLDIANMSYPVQLFTYMFRPLPFEAHSFASLMASIDNVVLLMLFIFGGYNIIKKKETVTFGAQNRYFMWLYSFGAWSILAMTTANLGIAVRQKWMIAPILIFLFLSVIGNRKRTSYES